ncbi:MAG: LysE family transporter [Betaproteobacteria bacterium]|nr:LysE family transporter [Betaproteobacteria bacterium]
MLRHSFWIGLIGAVFLFYLGFKNLFSRTRIEKTVPDTKNLTQSFLSTLGLTLANPPTILAFAAIFAGLGLVADADYGAAALIVAGVFLGSAAWWLILAAGAGWLRARMGPTLVRAINVVSGLSILGFAAWQLRQLFL